MKHRVKSKYEDGIIINILIPNEMFQTVLFELLRMSHPLAQYIRKCLAGDISEGPFVFSSERLKPELKNIVKDMVFEYYNSGNRPMIINGFLSQFFGVVINEKYQKNEDYIISVMEYINDNYQVAALGELSRKIGYNEAYLSRLIKKETGKTFSQLVRQARIAYAQTILVQNDTPVQEVGELVGYYDYAGFARAFEKETGVKPAEYRKNYQGKRPE